MKLYVTLIVFLFIFGVSFAVPEDAAELDKLQNELEELSASVNVTELEKIIKEIPETEPQPSPPEPSPSRAERQFFKAGKLLKRMFQHLEKRLAKKSTRLSAKAIDLSDTPEAAQQMAELQNLTQIFREAADSVSKITDSMSTFFEVTDAELKETLGTLPVRARKKILRRVLFHHRRRTRKQKKDPVIAVSK